ncbi:hypothetical protein COT70_00120 [candidate division WWE3 bacterium CG09_land_8_20_14_0_10_47_33]|uniref:Uncharacterized protein n=1 Tax=candidate division WWE3 bacterium CG_4_9_14_0_2_um_filter_48_10 TaxID=1975078 RepID=A0A2M8EJ53_UNCKA|nr:MAG: hypothetical protein COT70_00120 [candidate division WWE3 bacterium CG09_land_8_20_14_0_10_47_33]PIZ40973.1 MAG: hypothetical protein COY35_01320 [candidate division WWE3 bacterium CG_4_10_14_0_2_um_filter_47_8]PJC22773.1 MAG: hypothetical protein CO059_01620 [candidate division WWE3 bacterium CG_4_9_14_0_2_um_filter_48_10]PJE51395.1 MAG: hypothetical protein COV28_02455 [candidate division WWE3 bacterium CG10_big_fil_rev_8_21_14_0_10_48_23]
MAKMRVVRLQEPRCCSAEECGGLIKEGSWVVLYGKDCFHIECWEIKTREEVIIPTHQLYLLEEEEEALKTQKCWCCKCGTRNHPKQLVCTGCGQPRFRGKCR